MIPALAEIKARLSAATPGPWTVSRSDSDHGHINYQVENFGYEHDGCVAFCSELTNFRQAKKNAELIAHAPTDISRLISALELAIEQRDGYSDWFSEQQHPDNRTDFRKEDNAAIARVLEGK